MLDQFESGGDNFGTKLDPLGAPVSVQHYTPNWPSKAMGEGGRGSGSLLRAYSWSLPVASQRNMGIQFN